MFTTNGVGGLCRACGHNLAAHVPVPVIDDIVRLLQLHKITRWSLGSDGPESLVLTIHLTSPRKASK
jgi:hypothetical protein